MKWKGSNFKHCLLQNLLTKISNRIFLITGFPLSFLTWTNGELNMAGTFLPNKNGIFLQYLIVYRCKSFTFVVTGSMFLYSTGNLQLLCITDMEMVKEIGLHKSLSLGKPSYLTKDRGTLLGQGILSSSGPIW